MTIYEIIIKLSPWGFHEIIKYHSLDFIWNHKYNKVLEGFFEIVKYNSLELHEVELNKTKSLRHLWNNKVIPKTLHEQIKSKVLEADVK